MAALREQQEGETVVRCQRDDVTLVLTFGWRLSQGERDDLSAVADMRAGAPWESLLEAVGDLFRGSEFAAEFKYGEGKD